MVPPRWRRYAAMLKQRWRICADIKGCFRYNLTYTYKPGTNQLDKIVDAATGDYDRYRDIKKGQASGNYQYDAIGNLISDVSEGITNINWTVYGKINPQLSVVCSNEKVPLSVCLGLRTP